MKISVVGTGYVGLSTGVGFASKGNQVTCVDIDKDKVDKINSGVSPIYEPKINEYIENSIKQNKLTATTDLKNAILNSDITFITVPTPQSDNGSIDLSIIKKVSSDIGGIIKEKKGYHIIAVKSTVVPGTTEEVILPILEKESGKEAGKDFGICMNPEFLREGKAIEDFLNPDRIVIGTIDEKSGAMVEKLYNNFESAVLRTTPKAAEMIKYASNALLATKISFANEIGNLCKKLGIDVYDVMRGVGMDSRISPRFLDAGAGFGGSCFPKDVSAIIKKSEELNCDSRLLRQVLETNKEQRKKIADKLEEILGGIEGKKIAVLGLSFKPDSDDIRESPAIDIISMLKEDGANVSAYDPEAADSMKTIHPDIEYCRNTMDCLKGADACVILTDWEEFKKLTDKDFNVMKNKTILEGRKVLSRDNVKSFEGICWPGHNRRDGPDKS